jgi:hypothetical protein
VNAGGDVGLASFGDLAVPELRKLWVERLGQPPPQLRTRELLSLALAYRIQAEAHGGLPGDTKRRLAELERRFSADRSYRPAPPPRLKPGCSLIREWRGVRHEVRVLKEGFSYQGEGFGSLSQVAHRITGTKWNGLVFFGLKARAR